VTDDGKVTVCHGDPSEVRGSCECKKVALQDKTRSGTLVIDVYRDGEVIFTRKTE
jgi:hypothetical protein